MIQVFIDYLRHNRGLSENTLKAYADALRKFARFINCYYPGTSWRNVTKNMIDNYVKFQHDTDVATQTIKMSASALRTFYKTLMAMGAINNNPARFVSTPKNSKRLPVRLTKEAIKETLQDKNVDAQAKAAIAIIYETGIRLQELLDLRAGDIDAKSNSIKVHGKGNKERTVYYGDLTKQYGRCWKPTQHTQRDTRFMVYDALKNHSNATQLSPHAIRHTFASELVNNGMALSVISQLLGHKSVKTTEIYTHLANDTAKNLYATYHPAL